MRTPPQSARALDDQFGALVSVDARERARVGAPGVLACQTAFALIAAPTGEESARADAVARTLRAVVDPPASSRVRQDAAGNVIARVDPPNGFAARAPVAVLAHLDTVFTRDTPLATRHEGGRVLLPGIADNGRGLAALVAVAAECARADSRARLQRPIEFVATVGEEALGNLRGVRHYLDERDGHGADAPTAVVVLDGPGADAVVHHAVLSSRVRVLFRGAGGHSWADAAPNAIHAAGVAIADVARIATPPHASIAVTRMGGGEGVTSTPALAWFDVDIRAREAASLARLREALLRIVHRARSGGIASEVRTLGERPGGAIDADHALVRLAARASEWQGYQPVSAMASTDANIPLSRGIPAIAIGAGGRGGGMHTTAEWYDDTDGHRGVLRALAIVTALARD